MADSNELQALEKISTEVDEAQIKVILATQCIKAQAFIVEKLKKQTNRNKERCSFMSNANMKLQSEITQAEQEIKSLQIAKETIRTANVELQREWLVAKEKRQDFIEKVKSGEKKYEELWLKCKTRYESLPFVQKLLKAEETVQSLKNQLSIFENQAESLYKDIIVKKDACLNLDNKRVIQLAEFMIHERPKIIEKVSEKSKAISDLTNELKRLHINATVTAAENKKKVEETKAKMDTADEISKDMVADENAFIMPKLQLDTLHLDEWISVKLDQVKMKKIGYTPDHKEPFSKAHYGLDTNIFERKTDVDESIVSYFQKFNAQDEENKTQNYSKKKLINILEDVKIDDDSAMNIIAKVNPDTLQLVEKIGADNKTNQDPTVSKDTDKQHHNEDNIEEIDMTSSNEDNLVKPPTQFLDGSLKTQNSQELNKSVSLSLPSDQRPESQHDAMITCNNTNGNAPQENDGFETIISQLDVSAVSDDGFTKIKDMVLKKHNLVLSPQFVYAKNTMLPMNREETVVTSKFFKNNENQNENKTSTNDLVMDTQNDSNNEISDFGAENKAKVAKDNSSKIIELEDDDMVISSPKKRKIDELSKSEKPFTGYLFKHGPQGIPESLDVSMSTTGYDGDADFPHYLDSSLLLSPKADVPMSSENPEVNSQEVPNFLSGFRKSGLSFFGRLAGDSKPDGSTASQGNNVFSFNFGGDEKKNRGGLFSMFQ